MENHDETTVEISPSAIYQQDKAAIDVQISTAKAYPRNIKRSTENAIAIASMDLETANSCTYSLPRGGTPITGPSVNLALILAQTWGNLRVDAKVVSIDDKHVTSEAVCFDLETNLAIKAQVKRSIVGKSNKRYSDDMITVTGNAANSIAMRNAILKVIPRAVVNKVYSAAKQVITGDISDETKLLKKRTQVIDGLKGAYEVTEAEILSAIGKASVTQITADDIVVLIGIGTAIKEGDTTVEQAFRGKNTSANPILTPQQKEQQRIEKLLADCKTLEDLEIVCKANPDTDADLILKRQEEIKKGTGNK